MNKREECRGYCLAARNLLEGRPLCPGCDYVDNSSPARLIRALDEASALGRADVTPHAKNVTASESSRLKEEQRLLRALAQNTADLGWPSTNPVMVDLVERGLVAIIREYRAAWGGRDHRVAVLKITDAGRNHSGGSV